MGALQDDAGREARQPVQDDEVEELAADAVALASDTADDEWETLGDLRVVRDAKVVEGRDGFLFLANDNNRVLDQHAGTFRFGEDRLEGWRIALERRTALFAAHDCVHLVMVAPNNHSVYPEMLPGNIEMAAERPVHQLMRHLERSGSPVRVIYPLDDLVSAKREHLVASRVDSHWTDYGAFLAFRRLLEQAGELVPTRDILRKDVMFVDVDVSGDLGQKFDPPRRARQPFGRMRYRTARLLYDNCVEGTGALAVTDCRPAPEVTCLLVGDSYSYVLARFMSECWRRLVFAHAPTLDRAVVEASHPDIAVTVVAERFLAVVPDDEGGRSLRNREERKRGVGRMRHPLLHWTWPTLVSPAPIEAMRSAALAEGSLRDAVLVGVMAYAGLRPAEAAALRWPAVESDAIVVEPLPRRRQAGVGPRRVPLWKPLAEDLEAWREASGRSGDQLVFAELDGSGALDLRVWRDRVYPALARAAGIQSARPSFLRHVYCVLLINAGVPVEEIAALTDQDPADIAETFRGLLEDVMETAASPPEEAIAAARAVAD